MFNSPLHGMAHTWMVLSVRHGLRLLWLLCVWPALAGSPGVFGIESADVMRPPDAVWRSVALPHSWSRETPAWEGTGQYRLQFHLPSPGVPQQAWAIYLPRAGNRYALWLNGQVVGSSGALERTEEDHVHQPRYFPLPQSALADGRNEIRIELRGEKARYAGLGKVWVGPSSAIQQMHQQRAAWHQGGALVMVGLASVVGVIGLGFGWVMGARVYVLLGAAALLWAFRNTYVLTTEPPIGHPYWNILLDGLYGVSVMLLCSSVLLSLRISSRTWRVTRLVQLSAAAFLPWVYGWTGDWAWRQAFLLSLVVAVTVCVVHVLRLWCSRPSNETHVLGVAALMALGLAVYDHVAIMWRSEGYTHFALSRFSFLFILLSMAVLLMRRVLRSLNTARRFRQRQQLRLARARRELSLLHEERERTRIRDAELAERMRILSQMHDGVGAHLVAMRSLLNQAHVPTLALQHELTQAGLALRDSLRALQTTPDGWTAALAGWRDTLESRLQHANIALVWAVQEEPALPPPSTADCHHLHLWLTEAVTNAIKHSGASALTLSAGTHSTPVGLSWQIGLQDNGHGMAASRPAGLGMHTLDYRAQLLGAQMELRSSGQGTRLSLSWPL